MSMASDESRWSLEQRRARILLLAVLYLVFGHLSFLPLVQNVLVTPAVFYSEGIALAFALRYGSWVWPGIFLGQLALAMTRGLPWLPALGISSSNSMEACLAVWLFHRLGLDARLERARDLAGLILMVFFVLQPFSATAGNASLWLGGVIDTPADLALSWRDWWMGNTLGQMLVAPLLLALFAGQRGRSEAAGDALVSLTLLTPAIVAGECLWRWTGMPSVIVLLVPVLILIAINRGLVAVSIGGLFVAVVSLFSTGHGWGPFVSDGGASIVDLDIFLVGLTLGGQFIAVFLRQLARQRETEEDLRAAEDRLRLAAVEREKALQAQHRRDLEARLRTSLAAAAVAHEINQPLSTILLQSNMAARNGGDATGALAVVAAEARRVVDTIDRMKTLLRNVQTDHRAIDLTQVVRSSLLFNRAMLDKHRIAVHEQGLDGRHEIMGDDAQLLLALTNILRNAVEAIDEAGVERRAISIDLAERGDAVILTIGDSGPGWSGAEHAETPLTTTKSGGTGIGLYVVRTAVQNHGGSIAFGPSALGGAEVRLVFPRATGGAP